MSRYIDADELKGVLQHYKNTEDSLYYDELEMYIDDTPTADVEEVKTAVLEECANNSGFKCSRCKARVKNRAVTNETHKYCYKCGARFVGVVSD